MRAKMAFVSSVFFFLLCCSFLSPTDSEESCDYYAAVGANWHVPLDYELIASDNLKWTHKQEIVFNRIGNSFLIKKKDVDERGFLKLTNLSFKDSGEYTPTVFRNGQSVGALTSRKLCVLAPVQKPTLNMTCEEREPGNHVVKFSCLIKEELQSIKDKSVSVSWYKNTEVLPDARAMVLVKQAESVEKDSFTCNVSNRISFAVSAPVTQTCYESMFPDTIFGISIWVFVAGGGGIVLVLIVIVIVCSIKARRSRHRKIKEEAELRLQWANTAQQQQQQRQCAHPHNPHNGHHEHQHQHHHHRKQQKQQKQQQPGGHTGPRKHRSKPRPRAPESSSSHPPSHPQRAPQAQSGQNTDSEQPPPLPNPRTKGLKTQRV
ncbi:T-cell surface antigen CD2-like [Gouania willdenowi]|uniref:Ig-like domain-containing protein n=1 Tax=Gouania willdenowi TaxID=441366 RepID=A0A8C5DYA8_GOUWI|nr:T-cell surface antigen CD2 [Gouania willdenowi]